jgi:hypothetical protein
VKKSLQSLIRLSPPPQESCCIPAWFGGFFAGLFHPLDRQKKQFRPSASDTHAEDLAPVTLRKQIPVPKD